MNKTSYICALPQNIQNKIRNILSLGLSKNEIEIAMSGRICDIEELINVDFIVFQAA